MFLEASFRKLDRLAAWILGTQIHEDLFFFFHRADSYNLDSVASKLDFEEKKAEDRTLARLIIRETREHTSPSGGYSAKH